MLQVDAMDVDLLLERWAKDKRSGLYYHAVGPYGRQTRRYLHRIVGARKFFPGSGDVLPTSIKVTHDNHIPEDNRRDNIVLFDVANSSQRSPKRGKASRFRGVYKTYNNKWRPAVQYRVRGVRRAMYGTTHETEEAAAREYDRLALGIFPNPVLNFPQEIQKVETHG